MEGERGQSGGMWMFVFHQYSHALKTLIKLEFGDNINVGHYVLIAKCQVSTC